MEHLPDIIETAIESVMGMLTDFHEKAENWSYVRF
jgi:hypothetical protein